MSACCSGESVPPSSRVDARARARASSRRKLAVRALRAGASPIVRRRAGPSQGRSRGARSPAPPSPPDVGWESCRPASTSRPPKATPASRRSRSACSTRCGRAVGRVGVFRPDRALDRRARLRARAAARARRRRPRLRASASASPTTTCTPTPMPRSPRIVERFRAVERAVRRRRHPRLRLHRRRQPHRARASTPASPRTSARPCCSCSAAAAVRARRHGGQAEPRTPRHAPARRDHHRPSCAASTPSLLAVDRRTGPTRATSTRSSACDRPRRSRATPAAPCPSGPSRRTALLVAPTVRAVHRGDRRRRCSRGDEALLDREALGVVVAAHVDGERAAPADRGRGRRRPGRPHRRAARACCWPTPPTPSRRSPGIVLNGGFDAAPSRSSGSSRGSARTLPIAHDRARHLRHRRRASRTTRGRLAADSPRKYDTRARAVRAARRRGRAARAARRQPVAASSRR